MESGCRGGFVCVSSLGLVALAAFARNTSGSSDLLDNESS